MAATGVFGLTRFTALASGDVIPAVDISDPTQNAHGSLDAITVTNFFATVPVPVNVTSASATALAVGRLGATTPAFTVDSSTASQVAGLKVVGAVTTGTVAIVVTDSGAVNTNLTVNALGAGTIGIGSVSTGRVTITPATTITGALTQTGLATFNGGATIASGQTLTVTGATITGLTAASVATGTFPGVYTITGAVTLSGALTYGGVTLSNAVTGTGNMVLSASPTLTGTLTAAAITASGAVTLTKQSAFGLVVDAGVSTSFAGITFRSNNSAGISWLYNENSIGGNVTGAAANSLVLATVTAVPVHIGYNGVVSTTFGASGAVTFTGALSGITTLAATGAISNSALASGFTMGSVSGQQRISYDGTNFNFLNAGNGSAGVSGGAFTGSSFGGVALSSGAGIFAGAVSGITTLAGTGAISGFTSCVLSSTLTAASANTVTGSTVVNTGAGTVTLFTVPGAGVYVVSAYNTAGAVFASFIVADDGNGIFGAPTTISATSGFGAAASSHAFQINNTSGTNRTLTWSYLRIN